MIPIVYFRSSSFNEWGLCQHQFFLDYILGIPQDSNKKAEMGTMFHKVMECLANANLAVKSNQSSFVDRQLGLIPISEASLMSQAFVDRVFSLSYNYYTFIDRTRHKFSLSDKKTIYGWVCDTLTGCNSLFDPRKRDIVAAEPHFDFEINEPWAYYEYEDPRTGELIKGNLRIKGTVDLITRVGESMYEVVDWKTGQRKDWATDQEKDFNKLSVDPQLRMYHYAVSRMYPEVKQIVMTINWVRDGGPFTMAYGPEDIKATLEMLRARFEQIKRCSRPTLKSPNNTHFFCTRICSYGKNRHPKDPNFNICQYYKKKILTNGINSVMKNDTFEGHNVSNYSNPGE